MVLTHIAVMLFPTAHPSELVVTNEERLLGTTATTQLLKAVWAMRQAAADHTADTFTGPLPS